MFSQGSLPSSSRSTPIARREGAAFVAASLVVAVLIQISLLYVSSSATAASFEPSPGHPRILIRSQDVAALRAKATPNNPIWERTRLLGELARAGLEDADPETGPAPANQGCAGCESYALTLSFMALMLPDQTERLAYAEHSRDVIMGMVNGINQCIDAGNGAGNDALCGGSLMHDRGRWAGFGLPMAVDQLLGVEEELNSPFTILSAQDITAIRRAFRWLSELLIRGVSAPNYAPQPVLLTNDVRLTQEGRDRWSGNNHWGGRLRNLTFMALALGDDPVRDPSTPGETIDWNQEFQEAHGAFTYDTLRGYLDNVWGAWLYAANHAYNNDIRGGIFPEGAYYGVSTGGFLLQSLVALGTSGQDASGIWGPQTSLLQNRFWSDMVEGYLHTLPNTSYMSKDLGEMWQPALHGDIDNRYEIGDWINVLGPLGINDQLSGNQQRLSAARYIERNLVRGGAAAMINRVPDDPEPFKYYFTSPLTAILYFMLYEENPAKAEPDPRQSTPTEHFAPGVGRLYSRTGWGPNDRLFTFGLSWNSVEHMRGDGNDFGFWRKGEWLTRQRSAYANVDTSQHNAIAIENDPPKSNSGWRQVLYERGSQMIPYLAGDNPGDPEIVARSSSAKFSHLTGDATNMYNVPEQNMDDVLEATRSIVWVRPDHMIIYDRTRTASPGRFKRFWLQLTGDAQIDGKTMTMRTPKGQKLFASVLSPENAGLSIQPVENNSQWWYPVDYDPITGRLRVEATGNPNTARFLTVLEGADKEKSADKTLRVVSNGGDSFDGAYVNGFLVMFPQNLRKAMETRYEVPTAQKTVNLVTGLKPNAGYKVTQKRNDSGRIVVTVKPGGASMTDEGGVLEFSTASGGMVPGSGEVALFDGKRLVIRLKCPARFKPSCRSKAVPVTSKKTRRVKGKLKAIGKPMATKVTRKTKSGRWRLVSFKIRPAFRKKIKAMSKKKHKTLPVKQVISSRKIGTKLTRGASVIFHTYKVRTVSKSQMNQSGAPMDGELHPPTQPPR